MSKARELAELIGNAGGTSEQVLSGRRNLIINGGFDVWQRGTSFSELGANTYTADRWQAYDGSGYNATVTQSLSGSGSMSGTVLKYTAGTGQTSGGIRQIIEDGKAVAEQTVTLSFYARVASGTSTISSDIVMELSGVNDEVAGDVDFDLTTSWQKFSRTYTFTTSYGASVVDNLTCSVYIKDLIGNSVRYYIANVQLELGSVATPFEHRSYGEELALCQRYYERSSGTSHWATYNGTPAYTFNPIFNFNTTKRAVPSIGLYEITDGTGYQIIGVTTGHWDMRANAMSTTGGADKYVGWYADAEL